MRNLTPNPFPSGKGDQIRESGKGDPTNGDSEQVALLDSEGGGLDSVHPEDESWGVRVGDAFAADFLGETGQATKCNRQCLSA